MDQLKVGEFVINSVDNDGMMNGYDLELINSIATKVNIPVIACGGAGSLQNFRDAVKTGRASLSGSLISD